ncbi:hypothetical protein [Streptomyces goshikiensis]|uniref:hypothetical protein n=1 Tax=Streptomyces goshikiensis TaxID=1942 RepID=UPI0033BBFF71
MSGDSGPTWDRGDTGVSDQRAGTRLNGTPGPPAPGAAGGFASTPAEKKAAAGTIETELEPNTKKAAEHADDATTTAHKGFDGWETAAGLKTVADTWDQQVKTLMGRLSSEKVALRGASGLFTRNDIGLGNQFLTQSKLNGL